MPTSTTAGIPTSTTAGMLRIRREIAPYNNDITAIAYYVYIELVRLAFNRYSVIM